GRGAPPTASACSSWCSYSRPGPVAARLLLQAGEELRHLLHFGEVAGGDGDVDVAGERRPAAAALQERLPLVVGQHGLGAAGLVDGDPTVGQPAAVVVGAGPGLLAGAVPQRW